MHPNGAEDIVEAGNGLEKVEIRNFYFLSTIVKGVMVNSSFPNGTLSSDGNVWAYNIRFQLHDPEIVHPRKVCSH